MRPTQANQVNLPPCHHRRQWNVKEEMPFTDVFFVKVAEQHEGRGAQDDESIDASTSRFASLAVSRLKLSTPDDDEEDD